jgi:TetR/AcrR family transcriptional regulator
MSPAYGAQPAHTPRSTTRQPNPRETIARILEAAAEEFALHGLEGCRINQVAQRAAVTKQLIYHYFIGRDQLYAAMLEKVSLRGIDELLALDLDRLPAIPALEVMLNTIFDQYRRRPYLMRLALDQNFHGATYLSHRNGLPQARKQVIDRFEQIVDRGIVSGEIHGDIDPREFFVFAFTLMTGCFFNGATMSAYVNRDLTSDEAFDRWRRGAVSMIFRSLIPHDAGSASLGGASA